MYSDIIAKCKLRFKWKYQFWSPISSKKLFLQNVCLYVCLPVRSTGEKTIRSVSTMFAINMSTGQNRCTRGGYETFENQSRFGQKTPKDRFYL